MTPKQHRCLSCRHEWAGPSCTPCPACGHMYVQWVNYDEWRRAQKK